MAYTHSLENFAKQFGGVYSDRFLAVGTCAKFAYLFPEQEKAESFSKGVLAATGFTPVTVCNPEEGEVVVSWAAK